MYNRVDYRFFVNIFNANGKYSKKYLPGWKLEGFGSVKQIVKWMNQHLEDKSLAQKNSSVIFYLPQFFDKKKIVSYIENHFTTHFIVNWFDFEKLLSLKKTNNHAVGISIIKDAYDHYHIFYLNKGSRTISQVLYWFYIPPNQKKIIMDLISAAGNADQTAIEEVINNLIILKNTLSISIPQPPNHKRGTCVISNAIKNIIRVETIMNHDNKNDLRKYLSQQIASEVAIDKKLYEKYIKTFKEKTYHLAWLGAFEFAELFEKTTNRQSKLSLIILFLQGILNRFQKSHFSEPNSDKLKFELKEITDFFNHLLDSKYYEAALIFLLQFAKSDVSRRTANKLYQDCFQKMASLPNKIILDDTFMDMIAIDMLTDIHAKRFTSAYAQYELLKNVVSVEKNSLCQLVLTAITENNFNLIQSKLSSPVDADLFYAFAFLLSLDKEYADLNHLPKIPSRNETLIPLFLHTAVEMGKLKTVKYLLEQYKINVEMRDAHGQSVLDIAAQYGHLNLYKYLINHSLHLIDSSIKNALFYQAYEIVRFALDNYSDKINKDVLLCALACNDVFENINLNQLLQNYHFDKDFIFSFIIFSAVVTDHFDKVKLYLEKNDISIDYQSLNKGNTLLHYIVFFARTEMFSSILQYSPELFIKNKQGKSPFQIAIDRAEKVDTFKIIDFYLDNYFSSIPEEDLNDCLRRMVGCGKIEIVEKLLRQHPFTHQIIQLALWDAVRGESILIANKLMQHGASINEPNAEGNTIMHVAASKGDRTFLWAYENQGNLYAKNSDGILPIEYAKFESMKSLLIQVITKLYNERAHAQLYWSYYFDPVIDLLKQLGDLIKRSSTPQDFLEKCDKWCCTRNKAGTQNIEVLYKVDSIKLTLEPWLNSFLSLSSIEDSAGLSLTR